MFEESTSLLVAAGPESTSRLRSTTQLRRGGKFSKIFVQMLLTEFREDPLVSTFNYLSSNYHLISVNEVTISYTYINVIDIISNCLDLFPNYLFSLLCIILISKQFLCKLVSDEI